MIILIAGASHTGKTLLAQRLTEQYGYPCLSLDLLKMGLIRSGYTSLTPEDDEKMTDFLWPIVREMIRTAVENRQNLIMSEAYIENHFNDILSRADVIERRLDDSGCTMEWLKKENAHNRLQCQRHGCANIWIDDAPDGADYITQIDSALGRIRNQSGPDVL